MYIENKSIFIFSSYRLFSKKQQQPSVALGVKRSSTSDSGVTSSVVQSLAHSCICLGHVATKKTSGEDKPCPFSLVSYGPRRGL